MKIKTSSLIRSLARTLASIALICALGTSSAFADAELEKQLKEVVMADSALRPETQKQLISIIESVTVQNDEIQVKIREQKVLLLKAVLAKPNGSKEAKDLKRSLIKLNDQRLENSLKALESLREVLGHQKNPEVLFQKILELGGRY
jgi:hypothetical protein